MNIQRIKAVAAKEFIHIIRDPKSLLASIFIPIMLLVLFGWALNLDVDKIETVICDFDNSSKSRELISRISESRFFNVVARRETMNDAEKLIMNGSAVIMLSVPAGFERDIEKGLSPSIGVVIDGSDSNRAMIGLGYLNNMIAMLSGEIMNEKLFKTGIKIKNAPVELRQIVWFNPELVSKNSIVPGLIAVIMTVIAAMITSLTIAREWEKGTMEQLISTPLRGRELIIGKLLPYIAIGYIDVFISVIMSVFLFEVPFHGSYLTLFIMSSIFLIGAMSMGILISIAAKTQLLANQLSLLTAFLPAFLLSGFAFSIDNMPAILQLISRLFPATYFVKILKSVFLKGTGFKVLFYDITMLSLYCVILYVLASRSFKKRLE